MNKKSCTAWPIVFVEYSVDSRPFVRQFARKFLLNYYSFSLKVRKYVSVNSVFQFLLLFTIIQSIFAVARGPQCCLPFAFFSALPSWLLSPPSLFWISKCKIICRFYCDNVLHSRLFLIYPWQISREIFSRQFTHNTWPAKIGHFFSCKLKAIYQRDNLLHYWYPIC